jgi:hypothetical protein
MGWGRWESPCEVLGLPLLHFTLPLTALREMIKIPQSEIIAIRREAEIIATGLSLLSSS